MLKPNGYFCISEIGKGSDIREVKDIVSNLPNGTEGWSKMLRYPRAKKFLDQTKCMKIIAVVGA